MTERTTARPAPYLPFALRQDEEPPLQEAQSKPLRAGDLCPACGQAKLDYDGLLNLACPECGFSGGGGCHT